MGWVGAIFACKLAIFGVGEVEISVVGFAMMGVFWVLDWVGVLSACGLAIIVAEDYSFGVGGFAEPSDQTDGTRLQSFRLQGIHLIPMVIPLVSVATFQANDLGDKLSFTGACGVVPQLPGAS